MRKKDTRKKEIKKREINTEHSPLISSITERIKAEEITTLEGVLTAYGGVEVDAMTVYSDIFRLGENRIQQMNEPPGAFKANPLGYYKRKGEGQVHYRIFFDDTFEETLTELQEEADFSILNGLTYFGRRNTSERASKLYAMIFDLDGVTPSKLNNFFSGSLEADFYPMPNYIILSGHGLHLYYVMEFPVSLYPNIKTQLKELKYSLTNRMWNPYTSTIKKKQFQGINQGFRVIGGKTKIEGVRVRAFRMNAHPWTLAGLSRYVPEGSRVDEQQLWKENKLTLDEARELYPDWYERIVVNGEPKKKWTVKRDLYDWWKKKAYIEDDEGDHVITYGHRYFYVMALAIYATKCDVTLEELRTDAMEIMPILNSINKDEPFTADDVDSALECCDVRYKTFPRNDIARLTAIAIKTNKRNGRKQALHLAGARAVQKVNDEFNGTNWREGNGRPSKEQIVREWRQKNPNGKKIDCERDTGLSRPTVLKWWDWDEGM